MGTVKLTSEEFEGYIKKIESLYRKLSDAHTEICNLDIMREEILDLIDKKADESLASEDKFAEPWFIRTEDLAKVVGLNWDDYYTKWKAKKKEAHKDEE